MISLLSQKELIDFIGAFISIAGYVIGLGAVIVIDLHGFFGRTSRYWTEATTRTHKITKPLIWIGIFLVVIGGVLVYRQNLLSPIPLIQAGIALLLLLNGIFLSFSVSPFLLGREKQGLADQLLPTSWQKKIMISLLFSDLGWWSSVGLFTLFLVTRF